MNSALPLLIIVALAVACLALPARYDPAVRLKERSERDREKK